MANAANSRIQAELEPGALPICEGDGEHLDDRWAAAALCSADETDHAVRVVAAGNETASVWEASVHEAVGGG